MQINVTYAIDPNVAPPPDGFKTTVQYAVDILEAAFTNNATINVVVGWNLVQNFHVGSGEDGVNLYTPLLYSYSDIKDALLAHATSPAQQAAYATLPASDPTGGGTYELPSAEASALGLPLPAGMSPPTTDSWVGVNPFVNWSYDPTHVPTHNQVDLVGLIEHEVTESMGRNSYLGTEGDSHQLVYGIEDLFRYSAPGVRQLAPGAPASTGYFSIDNGTDSLGVWNNDANGGDLGDWNTFPDYAGPGPNGQDSFDNEGANGVFQPLTQTDLTLMQILGWVPSAPENFVINGETYYIAPTQQSVSGLVIEPGGTVDMAAGGRLVGPLTFDGAGGLFVLEAANPPNGLIKGFVAGDTIDFTGAPVGAHPTVTLLSGNVLEIVEHNTTYDFRLDPNQDFSGQTFHVTGDGHGGTLIFIDPSVQSVTTSGAGITNDIGDLNAGHSVTFTVNMNEDVFVDTTNGTPTLSLDDGGTATFSGGSGSPALAFTYNVAAGENTPDLTVTAFDLNGATARDQNGHDATFSTAVGNPPGTLRIDTTPPHLNGAALTGSSWVFSFDEPVLASANSTFIVAGEPSTYDAAATAALHDPTKAVFDFSPTGPAEPAAPGHELTGITDHAGNAPTVDIATATPVNPIVAFMLTLSEIAYHIEGGAPQAQPEPAGQSFHLLA